MEPGGSTWILLDLNQAVQAGEEDESTEEYSVKLAAALVYRLIREQKSIGLITYGDENRVLARQQGQSTHVANYGNPGGCARPWHRAGGRCVV